MQLDNRPEDVLATMTSHAVLALSVLASSISLATAQSACPNLLPPKNGAPAVAPGFQVRLIANGLSKPRGLAFDSAGHLLAVTGGITAFTLKEDAAGCVSVASKSTVASQVGVSQSLSCEACIVD